MDAHRRPGRLPRTGVAFTSMQLADKTNRKLTKSPPPSPADDKCSTRAPLPPPSSEYCNEGKAVSPTKQIEELNASSITAVVQKALNSSSLFFARSRVHHRQVKRTSFPALVKPHLCDVKNSPVRHKTTCESTTRLMSNSFLLIISNAFLVIIHCAANFNYDEDARMSTLSMRTSSCL